MKPGKEDISCGYRHDVQMKDIIGFWGFGNNHCGYRNEIQMEDVAYISRFTSEFGPNHCGTDREFCLLLSLVITTVVIGTVYR